LIHSCVSKQKQRILM